MVGQKKCAGGPAHARHGTPENRDSVIVRGASGRAADGYALLGHEALKLSGLKHLTDDVAAADELALNVELRDRRPVGIVLDALAKLVRGQDIDALVVDAEVVENLHHLTREAALRKAGRALHEEHHVVALDFVVDESGDLAHLARPFWPGSRPGGMFGLPLSIAQACEAQCSVG